MREQPIYPRVFLTPEGRPVGVRQMARAMSAIRQNPSADYPGWDWFAVPGYFIQREVRRGIHDRINRRIQA